MERLRYVRLSGRQKRRIWIGIFTALLAAGMGLTLSQLKPLVTGLATARVTNQVNRIVVAAVNEAVERGDIRYEALIRFEKDESGRVTALQSNMAEFNRLQVRIADDILARLSEVSTSELLIPLGTLTGSPLLAGRGPALTVRMQSVGSAAARLRNEFSAAGINQTRHQIILDVDVSVSILLPGYTTSARVTNEVAVAETVIVGSVPENYTYFSTLPEELDDYAEDYVLNNG